MNKQMQKGFTLIELMVVIVIIGILAAIAIPSYLDNANRAKITEGINLMAPVKSSVSETYIGAGKMLSTSAEVGLLDNPSSYATDLVDLISYNRVSDSVATITVDYNGDNLGTGVTNGSNDELVFQGTGSKTGVIWSCKGSVATSTIPLPDKYRPQNCRG